MLITFDVGLVHTKVAITNASAKEILDAIAIINIATMARPSGYMYMPKFKSGRWDGYIRLFKHNKFPTGLLHIVIDHLRKNEYDHVCVNNTWVGSDVPFVDSADIDNVTLNGIILRDYQVNAAKSLLCARNAIAKMATNSGKTEVFISIASIISGSVLILTTKKDIMYQTVDRIECRTGESAGVVGDGKWDPKRITVGMIQTLHNRDLSQFDDLACVVFDECHHVSATSCLDVMLRLPAYYRFGFSGTPLRYDALSDLRLIGATGPVVVDISNEELIDAGVSAKPIVVMYPVMSPDEYDVSWMDAYDLCIVHNDNRNTIISSVVTGSRHKSTLILVERIEHGTILSGMIDGAVFVHGSNVVEERIAALDLLRDGSGNVVIATAIFGEGVDVPAVDLLVLAGGGAHHVNILQKIGRGIRMKDSGVLHVVDFVDDTNKHLLRHSYKRAKLYEDEGFDVEVM